MNDPENFLSRWSRRKREAADESVPTADHEREQREAVAQANVHPAEGESSPPVKVTTIEAPEPAFDLAKLPPIESITAETDIRPFLAPGVPAELRLAALRRAWVADPKVRDFVGLNDYDFDFHTPGAIPGFGPLPMTDALRQELERIVGASQPQPETAATPAAESDSAAKVGASSVQPPAAIEETPRSESVASDGDADQPAQEQDELISRQATTQRSTDAAALQQEHSRSENLQKLARRGHGRALPQ